MNEAGKTCASLYTEPVRELVAIGAAIAANCEFCFKFHFDKARKLGVSREYMLAAVKRAIMVKNSPAKSIEELADKYLKSETPPVEEKSSCRASSCGCS
jgi:AhpD family alkylhydroperoxidase